MKDLAKLLEVSEADLAGFVACLRVWMTKGFALEEAIVKHQEQMAMLVNNSVKLARDPAMKEMAVDWFYG